MQSTYLILIAKKSVGHILVTGGAGFIGTNLCLNLPNKKEILVIDNLFNKDSANRSKILKENSIKIVDKDITEPLDISNIEIIYHLAAQASVADSFKFSEVDTKINVLGTLNVLELARKNDCPLVFTSSSAVYGNAKTPTDEGAPPKPISFYALSKTIAEKYCNFYSENYGLKITIFRLFNVYGPQGFRGAIPDFIRKLDQNPKKLSILGDGQQSKDFIHVSDVASALTRGVKPGTYNIGSGETTKIIDLARMVIKARGLKDVKIETGHENWPGDVNFTLADIKKLASTGWKPKIKLEEGIKDLVASLR